MKRLTAAMKQMLDALAFAHAGDNMSLRDKTRVMNKSSYTVNELPESVLTETTGSKNTSRRVALYLGSELPDAVIDYAISTCESLKHELVVLTFQTNHAAKNLLEPHKEAIAEAGIKMELVTLTGDPLPNLGRYLRKHPEIAFLTCKDTGYLGRSYIKGMQRKDIPVPVVVVTTSEEGKNSLENRSASDNDDQAVVA